MISPSSAWPCSGSAFGVGANLLGGPLGRTESTGCAALLSDAATLVAGWTPFGWAWAVPADVARGHWLVAGSHLLLAVALVGRAVAGLGALPRPRG